MLIEIHALKNYGPTCLNRDESGSPKTCQYGDAARARISSQCLKRTIRTSDTMQSFASSLDLLGTRTRMMPEIIAERLLAAGFDEKFVKEAKKKLNDFGKNKKDSGKEEDADKEAKKGKKEEEEVKGQTSQLIFYSYKDLKAIEEVIKEELEKCETLKDVKALNSNELQNLVAKKNKNNNAMPLDIALFGRMTTSNMQKNVEASMQVAHAISTGKVVAESDFWTATDDLISNGAMEGAGAGGMGDTEFNAACYYQHYHLDTDALIANLGGGNEAKEILIDALPELLEAIALCNPSGKQNSFAGHSAPSLIMVECKAKKTPHEYVGAYVTAVNAKSGSDIVEESIRRLNHEVKCFDDDFGKRADHRFWFCSSKYGIEPEAEATVCKNFMELVDNVVSVVK